MGSVKSAGSAKTAIQIVIGYDSLNPVQRVIAFLEDRQGRVCTVFGFQFCIGRFDAGTYLPTISGTTTKARIVLVKYNSMQTMLGGLHGGRQPRVS